MFSLSQPGWKSDLYDYYGTYTSDVSVTLPPIPPTISIGTYFGDDYISAIGDKIASLDKEEAKELLDYLKEKGL